MDLVKFKEIFDGFYRPPSRMPELRHYHMVYGLIILLFYGLWEIEEVKKAKDRQNATHHNISASQIGWGEEGHPKHN